MKNHFINLKDLAYLLKIHALEQKGKKEKRKNGN